MTPLEQAIAAIRALPPEDRRQLQEWLREQEQRDAEEELQAEKLRAELDEYRRAKQWLAAHRAEYLGQWVALEGDRLIAHGPDGRQVYDEAKAAGVEVPFIHHVVEEPEAFYPGWR
jgi:hypothetical protein